MSQHEVGISSDSACYRSDKQWPVLIMYPGHILKTSHTKYVKSEFNFLGIETWNSNYMLDCYETPADLAFPCGERRHPLGGIGHAIQKSMNRKDAIANGKSWYSKTVDVLYVNTVRQRYHSLWNQNCRQMLGGKTKQATSKSFGISSVLPSIILLKRYMEMKIKDQYSMCGADNH